MIVEVSPRRLDVRPGYAEQLEVTVSNTGDVIAGFTLRLLGADPGWVHTTDQAFSLFPDETRTVQVQITVPHGIVAGERRVAVQVRELTPPEGSAIEEVVLVVPEAPSVQLQTDPMAIHTGRRGRFSLLVDNTGNTTVAGVLAGVDAERKVRYRFNPPTLDLAPGEHTVVDLRVKARPPLLGSPVVRVIDLHLDDPGKPLIPAPREPSESEKRLTIGKKKAPQPVPERDTPPLANATFIQKATIGRGLVSLVGLLGAITVFAIVITVALSRLVGQSAADRNLALEIASARDSSATTGTSSLAGTVRYLTSGQGVPSVTVTVYAATDAATPLATTATDAKGAYRIGQLAAGDYLLTYRGAGFTQLWYPQALDPKDATAITLGDNHDMSSLDVSLGGVPATITGTVKGDSVAGATLTLRTPAPGATTSGPSINAPPGSTTPASYSLAGRTSPTAATSAAAGGAVAPPTAGAVVKTVTIGDDGTFSLDGVPSPSVYEIDVSKDGYATSSQLIDVGAGETRSDLNIVLRQGDGAITGSVVDAAGGVAGATLTATAGSTTVTTASLDGDQAGQFAVRGLPTPGRYTVVISKDGYATQTVDVTLAAGQSLTDQTFRLDRSTGSLQGQVLMAGSGQPGSGVGVSVTDGSTTIQTATEPSGAWRIDGLPLPGTYTLTFFRSDLASHTLSVSLDASGAITAESQGDGITATSITVQMHSSTAVLAGTVSQVAGSGSVGAGEALVTVTSGSSTYTITTASLPAASAGAYEVAGLKPGTYTVSVTKSGVRSVSTIVTLTAGSRTPYSPTLQQAASVSGTVKCAPNAASCADGTTGWIVEIYKASDYPSTVAQTARLGSDGTFEFKDLDAPTAYVVQVRPSVTDSPVASTTLQLDPSQQLTGVTVQVKQ